MKKIIAIVAAFAIVGFNGFMLMEASVMKAQVIRGWEVILEVTDELAYTCPADQTQLDFTTIAGMTGGTREIDTSCTIETNNDDGWEVRIYADNAGKMVDGTNEIEAYPTTTPATWVFPDSSKSYYGYYASSSKAASDFGTTALYRNLIATPGTLVAEDSDETDSDGIIIDFGFKVEIGTTRNQPSGEYSSFVTTTTSLK